MSCELGPSVQAVSLGGSLDLREEQFTQIPGERVTHHKSAELADDTGAIAEARHRELARRRDGSEDSV